MKRFILVLLFFVFTCSYCLAGTAGIFDNYKADKLRDKIIKLYVLEGAQVENYVTNANSFSIAKNNVSYGYNFRELYNYTIVQDGKNAVVSLAISSGVGAYSNFANLTSSEQKELERVKGIISGYYSYGLSFPEKTYFYNEYNQDGMLVQKNVIAGSQRFRGFKLTAVSYDAKAKGLYIGDRIIKVNGIKLKKYSRPELAKLFKPTSKDDFIDITYKRGKIIKDIRINAEFVKPKAGL